MPVRPTPRPLRRLRRALALLAGLTAVAIAAACKLESIGRVVAAVAAAACLVAWLGLLEVEGRASERLESRLHRRGPRGRYGRQERSRPRHAAIDARHKPQKQTARSGDRAV